MKVFVINYGLFFNGKLYPVGSQLDYPDSLPVPPNVKKVESEEQIFFRKRGRPRSQRPSSDDVTYPNPEE